MIIDFKNKVALVTGGTMGIGKAIADALYDNGASLIITGVEKELVDQINAEKNPRKACHYVDFSSDEGTAAFLLLLGQFDKIDILVNNAGINIVKPNRETSIGDFNIMNSINLKAPYLLAREVSKLMIKNHYGRIVNISSIWSVKTRHSRSLYTTTKSALVGLTKTLSVELGEHGILVNAVGPGFTMTELTIKTNTPEDLVRLAELVPVKRLAQPAEIANFVAFLSSELNTYITGQNLIIDGGFTNV
ncbi:MAG: SDR family oxidoreductase [Deltaproteobacteria bacterium]